MYLLLNKTDRQQKKGEKGIRTLDTVSMSVFKTDAIDHSAISPNFMRK